MQARFARICSPLSFVLLAAGLLAGCGGKKGSLSLSIITSPNEDPFQSAREVRVTIGGNVKTASVDDKGKFNLKLEFKPLKDPAPIVVECLDDAGNVFASGKTPSLPLIAGTSTDIAVWVARHGTILPAKAALPTPRTDLATAAVEGLGALIIGGREATGGPLSSTVIYNIYTHSIIETVSTSTARAGGVAVGTVGARGIVFGGSTQGTAGAFDAPVATAELFDPSTGNGLWTPISVEPTDARSFANVIVLGSGTGLVTGGLSATGAKLGTAALLQTSGTARLTALSTPMASPRAGHAVAPCKFADGDGAILFGGLGGDTGEVAERLVGQSFSAYALGVPNRDFAAATALPDGSVLITGGVSSTGTESSAIHVVPVNPPLVTVIDNLLSVPRERHTVTLVGDDVLICGGDDNAGTVHASCDLVTGGTLQRKTVLSLSLARTGHQAIPLETGPVLIVGGRGADGKPIQILDMYTP